MLFELRQYRTRPGQRERWVKFMEEVVIPYNVAKGVVVVGSFVGEEEDDLYVWIRRFDSEEERARLYKEIYESDYWKTEVAPLVSEMIDRSKHVIARLQPTPRSVIR
ncbi:MAG TPA: NIPSNAP family protein [Caldilineaceae bacterium]|nr:NIPSNAP family protein [Caldilineaceae bacterium]